MDGIAAMGDERNFIGDKVEYGQKRKRGDQPVGGDESEVWVHCVQVQPAHGESESKQRQVSIQARGQCQAEGCPQTNDIHKVFLFICIGMLLHYTYHAAQEGNEYKLACAVAHKGPSLYAAWYCQLNFFSC